ncbi:MAG TPA: ABC transporter ATP-binding protein [Actinomycetota bacterium]|nr:ABC transporter ATP-binding protein [Actinomycetota bacterium]
MAEVHLEVRGLSKVYRSGRGLHDVHLALPRGAIVALGGPNGSGKSTLLRCLAGLATYRGEVRLAGRRLDRSPSARAMVGFLPQSPGFPAEATVGEVLGLFARLRGAELGRDLPPGFLPPADERMGALSEGGRHRVGLAVALLGEPALLLLDEPLANLDEEGRRAVRGALRARCHRGATAIVSSPSPTELEAEADVVVRMEDGRIAGVEARPAAEPDALGVPR